MHVIQMSGGMGSFSAARRVVAEHGTANTVALFADTLVEHPSLYTFLDDACEHLGVELVVVADGRTPWQVFFDQHFIGNSRLAPCSKWLKQVPCRTWLEANCDPADTVVYVGIDADEPRRLPGVEKGWDGWNVRFPMSEEPHLTKEQMIAECRALGITVPLLYELNYPHNNCSGLCVRAGQRQWLRTLQAFPYLYAEAEAEEERFRRKFRKNVAILRETVRGERRPLTLAELRRRFEAGTVRVPVPELPFIPAAA